MKERNKPLSKQRLVASFPTDKKFTHDDLNVIISKGAMYKRMRFLAPDLVKVHIDSKRRISYSITANRKAKLELRVNDREHKHIKKAQAIADYVLSIEDKLWNLALGFGVTAL
jgi:hypothetical protein